MDIGNLILEFCIPLIAMAVFCVCFAIKKAQVINDKYIPLIALGLGAISGVLMNGLSYEAVAQGIASGACAIAIHQVWKQLQKDDGYSI